MPLREDPVRRSLVAVAVAALAGGALLVMVIDGDRGTGDRTESGCSKTIGDGFELTYIAQPRLGERADVATLEATAAAICERARATGAEAAVSLRGDAIVVRSSEPDPLVARSATLRFYDWEPNVIGPDGRPGSGDPDPIGRIRSLYEAVARAARSRPVAEASDRPSDRGNDSEPARAYFFRRGGRRELIAGPDTRNPPPPDRRSGIEMVRVPRGVLVLEHYRSPDAPPDTPGSYFVIEDDVELASAQIGRAEQNFDPVTEEPIVVIELEPGGRAPFERLTKRIVRRGERQALPPSAPRNRVFQRFVIALDDEIAAMATIDHVENPNGIDGRVGAQLNGIGSLQDTQALAKILRLGPLPVRLVLASRRRVRG